MAGSNRRFKIDLDIDSRTSAMTDEALVCRTFGHKWERRSASRKKTLELLRQGMVEYFRYCENGCGSTWIQVWNYRNRELVLNQRDYPRGDDYKMPKGQGRLRRGDAFAANLAREFPEYV